MTLPEASKSAGGSGSLNEQSKISRRRFVAIGAGGLSLVTIGAMGGWASGWWRGKTAERLSGNLAWARQAHLTLEERIVDGFHFLRLDPDGVRMFAHAFQSRNGVIQRFQRPKIDPFEQFLLSTDFFPNGADEARTVRYVALFDPYLHPCWNPCRPTS